MTFPLTIQETLIWHDIPQLFVAKDKIEGLKLCLAIDDSGGYIGIAISNARLQALKSNQIDLRTAFVSPELNAWFRADLNDNHELLAQPIATNKPIPEEWLPEANAFLPRSPLLTAETFEAVKVGAIAKEAGMNPTLLRQYLSGIKRPSTGQALRVQDALHRVAQRLLETRFV